mmetsp:Transcript_33549/g.61954  ORF Transcript_33549/g.61954 Transcript_33549/m.61954 type:complete len:204 (+) Transcript_33549:559-1170(+)
MLTGCLGREKRTMNTLKMKTRRRRPGMPPRRQSKGGVTLSSPWERSLDRGSASSAWFRTTPIPSSVQRARQSSQVARRRLRQRKAAVLLPRLVRSAQAASRSAAGPGASRLEEPLPQLLRQTRRKEQWPLSGQAASTLVALHQHTRQRKASPLSVRVGSVLAAPQPRMTRARETTATRRRQLGSASGPPQQQPRKKRASHLLG